MKRRRVVVVMICLQANRNVDCGALRLDVDVDFDV